METVRQLTIGGITRSVYRHVYSAFVHTLCSLGQAQRKERLDQGRLSLSL